MSKIIPVQRASYALIHAVSNVAFLGHCPSKSLSNGLWRRGRKGGNGSWERRKRVLSTRKPHLKFVPELWFLTLLFSSVTFSSFCSQRRWYNLHLASERLHETVPLRLLFHHFPPFKSPILTIWLSSGLSSSMCYSTGFWVQSWGQRAGGRHSRLRGSQHSSPPARTPWQNPWKTLAPENQRILEFKLKWKCEVHISSLYFKLPGPMES